MAQYSAPLSLLLGQVHLILCWGLGFIWSWVWSRLINVGLFGFSQYHLLMVLFFSFYFWPLYKKLWILRCIDFCLGHQFDPIDQNVCVCVGGCQYHSACIIMSPQYNLKTTLVIPSAVSFFFSELFYFHCFRIFCVWSFCDFEAQKCPFKTLEKLY